VTNPEPHSQPHAPEPDVSLAGVAARGEPAAPGPAVTMDVTDREITALVGLSGCGKSTILRCLNRMNDLVGSASVKGSLLYRGEDLYGDQVGAVEVRKRIGMVFQKPNPFPKLVHENIG